MAPEAPANLTAGVGSRRLPAWSDRPGAVALTVLVTSVAFVLVRLAVAAHGDIARFVLAEREFVNPARAPRGLPILPRNGYDGQFFYRLAIDPANLHRTAFGITLDSPDRLVRIGYPAVAWLVSFGQLALVPVALVVVNVAALVAIGFLGGVFARDAGRHALWGLLLAGYFGFVLSLSRDTAEPLAAAFMLAGVLAYRRRWPVLAGVLLACGCLTRETVMVAAGAIAVTRLVSFARRRCRPGREDLAWLVPTVAFVAWEMVVHAVIGVYPLTADARHNATVPFLGFVAGLRFHLSRLSFHDGPVDVWVLEVAVLFVFIVMAAISLRSSAAPVHERVAFIAYAVELSVLSSRVWDGVVDLRSIDEVFLFAALIVIASPRRSLRTLAAPLGPVLLLAMAHWALAL